MCCTITYKRGVQKKLLDEAKKNKEDYSTKLAGQIEKETGYSDEARERLLPYISSALGLYNQAYEAYTKKKFDKTPEYILSALWINYQKKNEFNPPHDHDGKLSFVIYLGIPEELKKETKSIKVGAVDLEVYSLSTVKDREML